ncbi:hypothetical protein NPIL_121691 [Nephila pilipes]|uniref:Uncharacterized protein n=1 Tax=Nephila pilipes TaxID=299642 RepID=A0A8X6PR11_NEPPI|nr:hypothetical protein NPIL_121691 [Nephila pilipes]
MHSPKLFLFLMIYDSYKTDSTPEEELLDWMDVPILPDVNSLFFPTQNICFPRKMIFLVLTKVSKPPLSANHFPNMKVLVPKLRTPQTP